MAIKAARERDPSLPPVLVSQSASGQQGTVFYSTTLARSMADFDRSAPPLPKLLGEAGFQKYLSVIRESVLSTETYVNRYLPELSNPPEEVVSAAPEFWRPKPVAMAKPKPKVQEGSKPQ